MDINRLRSLAGVNEASAGEQIIQVVKAKFQTQEHLAHDVDNIRMVDGHIMYTYNGIIDCAILFSNGVFGDLSDTNENEVKNGTYRQSDVRWFSTIDELMSTINDDADPEADLR